MSRRCRAAIVAALTVTATFEGTAWACSVFCAHDGEVVLAGNNEDYYGGDPAIIWFVPAQAQKHGYVAYGYASNHFSQGGMNDQGLFWDGLATPALSCSSCGGTEPFTLETLEEVMQDSATVQEALDAFASYDTTAIMETAQLLFADAQGSSAILEGDQVIWPQHDFQIATNFYQSDPSLGGYPCWRYDTLASLMQSSLPLDVDTFRQMADAVHQGVAPGPSVYTRYTTIGDLKAGVLYLFHDMDFGRCVRFDLAEELGMPSHEYAMAELSYQPECWIASGSGGAGGAGGSDVSSPQDGPELASAEPGTGCGCRVGPRAHAAGWMLLTMGGVALAAIRARRRRDRLPRGRAE
ncbi:MAG: hypothetical protein IT373_08355 [Polyangiaceae bacterium]|nr:hypothetical protein [Polyangiaceae bacterium]